MSNGIIPIDKLGRTSLAASIAASRSGIYSGSLQRPFPAPQRDSGSLHPTSSMLRYACTYRLARRSVGMQGCPERRLTVGDWGTFRGYQHVSRYVRRYVPTLVPIYPYTYRYHPTKLVGDSRRTVLRLNFLDPRYPCRLHSELFV